MRILGTVIYKPFGLVFGLMAGLLSTRLFAWLWSRIDEEEPPEPNTEHVHWPKMLTAAALHGVIFTVVRTVVDRGAAKSFHHLTGIWPGRRTPDRA